MAKLAVGNQDQPTEEKQVAKSMDFSHTHSYILELFLNSFSLPKNA
jgi:hypothetical protein